MLMKKTIPVKDDSPKSEIVMVTPAMASAWLADNHFDNRRLDDRNVDKIARDIKAGKWVFDGNPIRFSKEGDVIDGQHRLWAIVMSAKPVQSLIIRGLEEKAKMVIDAGKARANADFFHFAGYQNTTIMAAVCRLAIGYRENKGDLWKWAQSTSMRRLTSQELISEAESNPQITIAVKSTSHLKVARKLLSPATVSFGYYLFSQVSKNPQVVDRFWKDFEDGTNLPVNSPILLLRNTFTIRDIDLKERHGGNKAMAYRLALVIKAWNAWKDGDDIKRLVYGVEKEKYPLPK